MKTKLIAVLLTTAMFVPAGSAYALTPLQEAKVQAQDRRAEIKNQIQERREDLKATVSGMRQAFRSDVAKLHADRLNNRFGFYNRRLTTVIEKIQGRIDKTKEEGKDVTAAQAKLDEAKAKLAESNKYAMDAVAKFRSIEPTKYNEQKSVALEARDLAEKGREAFVATVKLLRECVELLKALK
jgi:ABC-type amino acid transport substrate-binding protein